MKRLTILCLAAACGILAACHKPEPVVIPVSRMEFDPEVIPMYVGDLQKVQLKCYPENATNLDEIIIQNSNNNVATFVDGMLTAVNPGRTWLSASCGGVSAKAQVVVYSGWFAKGGEQYGVDEAIGYYYMYGESSPQEMEIELIHYQSDGAKQHFSAWIKYSNLGKTIDFLKDMDESQVSVWKNENEDGYSLPYKKEDGTPAVVLADWGYTDATVKKGFLIITDLTGGKFKVEADFALSNGYEFKASWEGTPSMKKEG